MIYLIAYLVIGKFQIEINLLKCSKYLNKFINIFIITFRNFDKDVMAVSENFKPLKITSSQKVD
jgi:hypothetical protein